MCHFFVECLNVNFIFLEVERVPEVVELEVLVGEERTPGGVQRWPPSTFVSEDRLNKVIPANIPGNLIYLLCNFNPCPLIHLR